MFYIFCIALLIVSCWTLLEFKYKDWIENQTCTICDSRHSLKDRQKHTCHKVQNTKMSGKSNRSNASKTGTPKRKVLAGNSLFTWLKKPEPESKDSERPAKRSKLNHVKVHDTVDLTDDDSDKNSSVSLDSSSSKCNPHCCKSKKVDKNREEPKILDTRMIGGIDVQFPVKPYPCQISVVNALIKGCTKKEHCLLESPTGSGKTLALLCGALAWQTDFETKQRQESQKLGGIRPTVKGLGGGDFAGNKNIVQGHEHATNPSKIMDGTGDDGMQSVIDEIIEKEESMRTPKIYYGSRTHKQIEQVIREFRKTIYRKKKMTILSSREFTCIQNTDRNKTQVCNELLDPKSRQKCPFYTDDNKGVMSSYYQLQRLKLGTPWDIEDLVELGEKQGACPYFAARSLMPTAEIIFCPYNYLIDPAIRESMQINLNNEIIILDEAHNIEDVCRDIGSIDMSEDMLEAIIRECEEIAGRAKDFTTCNSSTYNILANYIRTFLEFLKSVILTTPPRSRSGTDLVSDYWNGKELQSVFDLNKLGGQNYNIFFEACKEAISDYNNAREGLRKMDEDDTTPKNNNTIGIGTKTSLQSIMTAVNMVYSEKYATDYMAYVIEAPSTNTVFRVPNNTWTSNGPKRIRTLKLLCMNPAVIFAPIAQMARSIILASGTLSPTTSFQSELGTRFPHMLHANHVIGKDQVYIRTISHGPTGVPLRAVYDKVHTLPFKDDLGKLLLDVCHTIPHGVLCFFSSYSMMTSQIERWKETNVWDKIQDIKHILQEPRGSNKLDDTMKEFRSVVKSTSESTTGINGVLLFAVFRGKVAEGIDFSDNEARCVLTIGIPFAVLIDPAVKLKKDYNDKNQSRGLLSGSEWYTIQAFRALNQALGRCIRHQNDWGAVLLVDERLLMQSNTNYLPKWIKSLWANGGNNLRTELTSFVEVRKENDRQKLTD